MAEADERSGFECNICLLLAQDPVITHCGHLYCWPCIYRELKKCHANCLECPVCKAEIYEEKLVPLYGRGKTPTDPTPKLVEGIQIPKRPVVWRPAQFTTYTPLTKTSSTQMKTRRDIKL